MAIVKLDFVSNASPIAESIGVLQSAGAAAKKVTDDQKQGFKEVAISAASMNKVISDSTPTVNLVKQKSAIQELKSQIREYTSEAIKAGSGTKEFAAALQKAADKKAELKDLQQAVSALDPDTKAKAFLQLSQTIISGFAAGQGALSAFGVTSEDAAKTLVKLQSALALGQFLGQVGELGDTFSILKTQIQNSAAAQRAFNLVSEANPYVLLASAVIALGAALAILDSNVDEDTKSFKENNEFIKDSKKFREELRETIAQLSIDLLKERGLLNESQAFQLKEQIKLQSELSEIDKKASEEKKKLINENVNSFVTGLKAQLLGSSEISDAIIKAESETAKRRKIIDEDAEKQKQDTISASNIRIETENQKFINKEKQANEDKNKKKKEEDDRANKQKLVDIKKQANDEEKARLDALAKIAEENKKRYEKQHDDLVKSGRDLIKQLIEDQDEEEKTTKKKLSRSEILEKESEENKHGIKLLFHNLGIDLTNQELDGLGEFYNNVKLLAKNNAEAQKAFMVAETLISTFSSAQKSYDSLAGVPYVGPILGAVAAATAVAAGLARVAQIEGVQFAHGGYTGDGEKYQEAGIVHKGEFVTDKEKTSKHRRLLEAIHNDDYSGLKLIDLQPMLAGTGVVLDKDMPKNIYQRGVDYSQSQEEKKSAELNELRAIRKELSDFKKHYKNKPQETNLPDGTRIIKSGNSIRRIRKK